MKQDEQELRLSPSPHSRFGVGARLRFHYERFLAHRGFAIFINLVLLFFITYSVLLSLHLVFYRENWESSLEPFSLSWHVFLEMISPARLSALHAPPFDLLFLSVLTTFVGVGFYSLLIAYASTKTREMLEFFRNGLGPVIEVNHTLILGFDNRVARLIKELNFSNYSRHAHPVVVMTNEPKTEVDQRLSREIQAYSNVRVSTTFGEPSRIQELMRINASQARSAIVLARCSQTASKSEKEASDVRVLQTVKALYATQDPCDRFPIVAEIFGEQRRDMIDSLGDAIVTFDSNGVLASILVQSAIFPGVERVYSELFSFEMSEFYFYQDIPEGALFGDLIRHFEDGVPVGVQNALGEVILMPSSDYVFAADDELLLIARDDQLINYSPEPLYDYHVLQSTPSDERVQSQDLLIIGWHYLAPAILRECSARLPKESSITIVMPRGAQKLEDHIEEVVSMTNMKVTRDFSDPFKLQNLEKVDPYRFDTVLLLSRGGNAESETQMDADTLMLVLLLRRLRDKQIGRQITTRVVTQLFRSENEQLINNKNPEHDDPIHYVLTAQTATMLFTQLSEQGDMVKTYELLFKSGCWELSLCHIQDYTEHLHDLSFIDLYNSALCRGEICIGFTTQMTEFQAPPYHGMVLNPPKTLTYQFEDTDRLVIFRQTPNIREGVTPDATPAES